MVLSFLGHLFLQHQEVKHLVEHGQGFRTTYAFIPRHLASSLLCVHLEGSYTLPKLSDLRINVCELFLEVLLKELERLLLTDFLFEHAVELAVT